jgi:hypothetical protein
MLIRINPSASAPTNRVLFASAVHVAYSYRPPNHAAFLEPDSAWNFKTLVLNSFSAPTACVALLMSDS